MKDLLPIALTAILALPVFAQEKPEPAAAQPAEAERKAESSVWPAYVAVSQWPRSVDVIGLRLTIPFSSSQESVTGIDLGLWGKSLYFEGFQLNLLRSEVQDSGSGFQVGIYNSVGSGDMLGVQVGLWNEARSIGGVQAGLVNVVGDARGLQIGLINRAETMYGYQVGVVNVIRDAEFQFLPIVNVGF